MSQSTETKELFMTNSQDHSMHFVLEPWAETVEMNPGDTFRIVAQGPTTGILEIELMPDTILIFSWSGSTARVFHGEELVLDGSITVPETPKDMTVRGFVSRIFRGKDQLD
jgi:hypothetical protein